MDSGFGNGKTHNILGFLFIGLVARHKNLSHTQVKFVL